MSLPHATRPVQVWADVDLGIADLVEYLNTIPGVRTLYSCQGTIGEGGPHPYPAQVGVTWQTDETLKLLLRKFDITLLGNYWGNVHPRGGAVARAEATLNPATLFPSGSFTVLFCATCGGMKKSPYVIHSDEHACRCE